MSWPSKRIRARPWARRGAGSRGRASTCRTRTRRRARVSRRAGSSRETSSTALMSPTWRSRRSPLLIGNHICRFSTSTSGPPTGIGARAPQPTAAAFDLLPLLRRHRVEAGDEVAGLDLAERRHLRRRLAPPRSGSAAGTGTRSAGCSMSRGAPSIGVSASLRLASRRGIDWSRPSVYGWRGRAKSWLGGAGLHEHARVHHVDALAVPGDDAEVVRDEDRARCRAPRRASRSSSRICAWIVTSSAVVGSSAIRSFGSQARAMAIIARWRMPPENWCG